MVAREAFTSSLEKLARGSLTVGETIVSEKYSQGFYRMVLAKGCCNPEGELGEVIMDKLEKKMLKNEIDLEFLNQTLKPDCEYVLEDEELFFGDA